MGQGPYFASPTPRSFLRVFNIVSRAVSQSISPPPPVDSGGFFVSDPGRGVRSLGVPPFSKEPVDSFSRVIAGGFQGCGIGPAIGEGCLGPDWGDPGWVPIPVGGGGGGRGGTAPKGLGGAIGRCSPGLPGPCMTNGRGPPWFCGTGGLMGIGLGRGIP
jgi:hypothetical protein